MRKTIIAALGICFAVFVALSTPAHMPASAQSSTVTPAPTTTQVTCQNIVSRALDVLKNTCDATGRNNACYGNASIQAQLTSADFSFQNPGDKVPVKVIKTVTTSPLNQSAGTWGLSLFKLQANLPDTLPGQNVTFLVYGNTSVQNTSGDMKAFYFSTGLGAPSCDAVPNDSILVRSPDHEQVTFNANGVTITIASTVRLTAVAHQTMTVELIEGHATVSTPKGSRVLQPSQSVSIAMGGATGLEPLGVPSPATTMTMDEATLGMVSSLNTLTGSNTSIPIKGCITALGSNSATIGDVQVELDPADIASRNLKIGDCITVNGVVQTDGSGAVSVTPSHAGSAAVTVDNRGGSGSSGSDDVTTDDNGHGNSGSSNSGSSDDNSQGNDDSGHGNGKGNNGNGNGNGGGNGSNGSGNGSGNNGNGNGNGGGNGSNGGGNGNGNNGNGNGNGGGNGSNGGGNGNGNNGNGNGNGGGKKG